METVSLTVTEASRNFSDCVNRARYQGTTLVLHKNGVPVARIVPAARKQAKGVELAAGLHRAAIEAGIGELETASWLHDLEQTRGSLQSQGKPWHF
jgi:prevent-host-death family protein